MLLKLHIFFLVVCAVGQLKCVAQKAYILCSEPLSVDIKQKNVEMAYYNICVIIVSYTINEQHYLIFT